MSLEKVFAIIQARNNLCSAMRDSHLADQEFLVLNTSQSKPLVMETTIYKDFYWCIQNNMKPWREKEDLVVIFVAS